MSTIKLPRESNALRIPRRRVPVRIELTDGSPLTGALYADRTTASGAPGRVVDRLNDVAEPFVPLAVEDRHILLRKSSVLLVRMIDEPEASLPSGASQTKLRLCLTMASGMTVQGQLRAVLPRQRTRALDFLNLNSDRFLEVRRGDGRLTLVNSRHIARVIEVLNAD